MPTTSINDQNIAILLISSSKLLKNKFIEAISNDLNHFSLMNKSIKSEDAERSNVACFICDYTVESSDNQNPASTSYVQLIDANDKKLLSTLIEKSIYQDKDYKQFFVNSIVYLYDETNTDTFAFIQSIHNDLNKVYPDFMGSEHLICMLCNMINAANLNGTTNTRSSQDDSFRLINMVDEFLDGAKNFQYMAQTFEQTILGSRPILDEEDNGENKIKIKFDLLISRFLPAGLIDMNRDFVSIKSTDHSLKSAPLNKITEKQTKQKSNYKGEMMKNLRNGRTSSNKYFISIDCLNNYYLILGFGIYAYENKYFRYEGEWLNGVKHGNGKLVMNDGSFYEGDFRDGEISGNGYKFDTTRETEYTGEFYEGVYQGKGLLRCKNQFVYEGDFYENLKHGYGELNEFKINQVFKGQWYFNKRHGQGVQRYADGSTYTGI